MNGCGIPVTSYSLCGMTDVKSTSSGLWFPQEGTAIADLPEALGHEGVFLPCPLPQDLVLRSRTYRELASTEQALGRLDEAAERLSDRRALIRATQVREVQSSAGLEGSNAALREILVADLPGVRSPSALAPILTRHLRASDMAFAAAQAGEALNAGLWARISAVLGGQDGGHDVAPDMVWRTQPGWLSGGSIEDAYLLTSPSLAATKAALARLDAWIAAECALPLVGKLALGHYQMTVLQPFRFGNGHLARLYVGLELVRAGVIREQILPIAMWLDRHREKYRSQIRYVVQTGDFIDWIEFFAWGVREAAMDQVRLIKNLEVARDDLLARLPSRGSNRNTGHIRLVLADMLATPITNHKQIAARCGVSGKSATELTKRLLTAGLIENMDKKTYGKVFIVPAFMDLLTLNDPVRPARDREAFAADSAADQPSGT